MRLRSVKGLAFLRLFGAWVADNLRYPRARLSSLDCEEPFPEAGFDSFRVYGGHVFFARRFF
jgi:hypothetical protein